jgi:hypothetical protein
MQHKQRHFYLHSMSIDSHTEDWPETRLLPNLKSALRSHVDVQMAVLNHSVLCEVVPLIPDELPAREFDPPRLRVAGNMQPRQWHFS